MFKILILFSLLVFANQCLCQTISISNSGGSAAQSLGSGAGSVRSRGGNRGTGGGAVTGGTG